MEADEIYELFAIKYAENRRRLPSRFFPDPEAHDDPGQINFYVWLAVSSRRKILIDVGGTPENARARGVDYQRSPLEALKLLGVDQACIDDIILTHMHWDHIGNLRSFPEAQLHVQWKEMEYAVGACMTNQHLRQPYDAEGICELVRRLYGGKLVYHYGNSRLVPGVELYHVGGHSPGQQVARVRTRRGWVVVASDAAHLYDNLLTGNPYPILVDAAESVQGLATLQDLADTPHHIVPGHDPLVMERYPAASDRSRGVAVRIDVAPSGAE